MAAPNVVGFWSETPAGSGCASQYYPKSTPPPLPDVIRKRRSDRAWRSRAGHGVADNQWCPTGFGPEARVAREAVVHSGKPEAERSGYETAGAVRPRHAGRASMP